VRDGYPATTDGVVINGRTDTGGFFKARLETNVNMNETRSVYLNALAFKEGYNQETLTIFEIKVTIDQYILIIDQFDIDPDTILAGETSMVTIRVIYGKGIPVPNALVKFETLFGAVNPTSTSTAQDGKVNVIYSIPKDAEVPENGISVDLIADAEAILGGQTVKDTRTRSLTVNPIPRPPGTELPWLTIIVILIAIVAAVVIMIYLKRRR